MILHMEQLQSKEETLIRNTKMGRSMVLGRNTKLQRVQLSVVSGRTTAVTL
ncbi:MAG: hypothetical protein ACJA16_001639 [Akkermansiaceae bacterium]|jgi:hypothetical protein